MRGTSATNSIGSATLHRLGADGASQSMDVVYPTSGNYLVTDVPSGDHRWAMSTSQHHPQIFDGVDCPRNGSYVQFQNCSFANGAWVTTVDGSVREDVDFKLVPERARLVRVLDAISNAPL